METCYFLEYHSMDLYTVYYAYTFLNFICKNVSLLAADRVTKVHLQHGSSYKQDWLDSGDFSPPYSWHLLVFPDLAFYLMLADSFEPIMSLCWLNSKPPSRIILFPIFSISQLIFLGFEIWKNTHISLEMQQSNSHIDTISICLPFCVFFLFYILIFLLGPLFLCPGTSFKVCSGESL